MKRIILAAFAACSLSAAAGEAVTWKSMGGYVGQRLDGCIEKRVLGQEVDMLIEPFLVQDETQNRWASEFWGKWIQGAVAAYQYNHDPALLAKIEEGERKLIATQLPNGYIGDYDTAHQLNGWDVWGRKYTLLGLYKCYQVTGHKEALEAACRLLDYTIAQIGPNGTKPVYKTGIYRGMPPLSILEPVTFLYRATGRAAYLDFARHIAQQMNSPEGPMLIDKADVPVAERFPLQPGVEWGSFENGQKGYEMMSCYIGLLEMYRLTAEARYLQAALSTYNHIVREEINIVGGACSLECWYNGYKNQTHPASHTMETCVTFTWMQFCERLLQVTGEAKYVDQIERTMYNALFASTRADHSKIAMYTPLEGCRHDGVHQCEVGINCCSANAPRAYAMIPRVAYRTPAEGRIDVNLFIPSEVEVALGKRTFALTQQTNYPLDGEIRIAISPDKATPATIALRIPAWATSAEVWVNGEKVAGATAGNYCPIARTWQKGDEIALSLGMEARACRLNNCVAYERGPIVFARDSRFNDGFVDNAITPAVTGGKVDMQPAAAPSADVWTAVTVPTLEGIFVNQPHTIHLCDFASAGNTWDESTRYRVWLPVIVGPMNMKRIDKYW